MKKLTKVGVVSAANVLGVLGALTGLVKVAILPILAVIAAGSLGDVDTAIKTIGTAASKSVTDVITFGAVGWLGGAVWAWLLNLSFKWTGGLAWEEKPTKAGK